MIKNGSKKPIQIKQSKIIFFKIALLRKIKTYLKIIIKQLLMKTNYFQDKSLNLQINIINLH
jgi:hypothetical protein